MNRITKQKNNALSKYSHSDSNKKHKGRGLREGNRIDKVTKPSNKKPYRARGCRGGVSKRGKRTASSTDPFHNQYKSHKIKNIHIDKCVNSVESDRIELLEQNRSQDMTRQRYVPGDFFPYQTKMRQGMHAMNEERQQPKECRGHFRFDHVNLHGSEAGRPSVYKDTILKNTYSVLDQHNMATRVMSKANFPPFSTRINYCQNKENDPQKCLTSKTSNVQQMVIEKRNDIIVGCGCNHNEKYADNHFHQRKFYHHKVMPTHGSLFLVSPKSFLMRKGNQKRN